MIYIICEHTRSTERIKLSVIASFSICVIAMNDVQHSVFSLLFFFFGLNFRRLSIFRVDDFVFVRDICMLQFSFSCFSQLASQLSRRFRHQLNLTFELISSTSWLTSRRRIEHLRCTVYIHMYVGFINETISLRLNFK